MTNRRTGSVSVARSVVARFALVLAAVLLCLYQPLDTAANSASLAMDKGDTSLVVRTLSAFDIVDDALDHLKEGKGLMPHFQQVLISTPAIAVAIALTPPLPTSSWPPFLDNFHAESIPSGSFHPPRQ